MRLLVMLADADAEGEAAARWAAAQGWTVTTVLEHEAIPELEATDAVWLHGDAAPAFGTETAKRLRSWIGQGGGVVLTLLATTAASSLGAPGPAPLREGPAPWSDDRDPLWTEAFRDWPGYPHIRGLQGWGPHPLFHRVLRGTYTWCATEGEVVSSAVFRKPDWPDGSARVIAVERSYVHLGADVAVAWEYEVGRGRILCIGAHLRFTAPDLRFAMHRDTIVRNALEDAATPSPRRTHWPEARRRHAPVTVLPRPRALPAIADVPLLQPSIHISDPDRSSFTLAGSRALVVGTEVDGVSEVWLHPLCVLSTIEARLGNVRLICTELVATPGDVSRVLVGADGSLLRERLAVHPSRSEVHYHLLRQGGPPGESEPIDLTFRLPLRLEWPLPVDALVPMRVEVVQGDGRHAIVVTGRDGQHLSAVFIEGADVPVIVTEEDEGALVQLCSTDPHGIRLSITASTTGRSGLPPHGTLAGAMREQHHRLTDLKQRTAAVVTGDAVVDAAWPWAIARLGNFMADAAEGRGLMAGYAASRPGWGRSRPGYAWFFGRDSCWSVDALLAVGMHNEARSAIALLVDTADLTGQIAHEITTSGVVHYDAADATPLLLRAVAAYAEWTADVEQIRAWWPAVRRAVEFCVASDRDGDGLPENTGVGHGWIESGPLGGGAVTSYTASIWIDALRRLRPVADFVGDGTLAIRLAQLHDRALAGLEALRDPESGRLALHRADDGHLVTDLTALAAVPIALGVDTSPSADDILHALGAPRFSAPWGLRMLPTDDPRYDPTSYHGGAVWPLFTGWAALADARRGAVERAFARVRATALLATQRCKGAFDEVLHGDTGAGAGVCPDQAWSAAMLLTPIMTGLLGIAPNALHGECQMRPRLPRAIGQLAVHGMRVGSASLSIVCRQSSENDLGVRLEAAPDNMGDITVSLPNDRVRLRPGAHALVTLSEGD